jgi:hypothetical protein
MISSRINKSKNWFDVVAVSLFNKSPPKVYSITNKIFETSLTSSLINHPAYKWSGVFNAYVDISFYIKFILVLYFNVITTVTLGLPMSLICHFVYFFFIKSTALYDAHGK